MDSTDKMIAVIMSTYNGELYLAEQIDSILNQEDVDFKLFAMTVLWIALPISY